MRFSALRSKRVLFTVAALSLSGVLLAAAKTQEPQDSAPVAQLKKTGSCAYCDLAEAKLGGLQMPKADLTGANLSGAMLYKADLTEAILTSANLTNADLTGANLTGAVGAKLDLAKTTERTICPDGAVGPCK